MKRDPLNPDELLTITSVVSELMLSPSGVRNLIKEGKLKAFVPRGTRFLLFLPADVAKLKAEREKNPPTAGRPKKEVKK
jgi:hypothetical protein